MGESGGGKKWVSDLFFKIYYKIYIMSKKIKRKHHYVPATYLRLFSSEPFKWRESPIYIFDVIKQRWRVSSVEKVAFEKDFYKVDVKWIPPDIMEDIFNIFESKLAQVILKIDNNKILKAEEVEIIAEFIAFQEFRTHYRKEWVVQITKSINSKCWQEIFTDNDNFINFITGMFISNYVIWSRIFGWKWIVFHPEDNSKNFITSDHPLYLLRPLKLPSKNLWIYNSHLCFPLSKRSYLIIKYWESDYLSNNWWKKNISYKSVSSVLVDLFNIFSTRSINRFIFSSEKEDLLLIEGWLRWSPKSLREIKNIYINSILDLYENLEN